LHHGVFTLSGLIALLPSVLSSLGKIKALTQGIVLYKTKSVSAYLYILEKQTLILGIITIYVLIKVKFLTSNLDY
jgi:hypothetical protein